MTNREFLDLLDDHAVPVIKQALREEARLPNTFDTDSDHFMVDKGNALCAVVTISDWQDDAAAASKFYHYVAIDFREGQHNGFRPRAIKAIAYARAQMAADWLADQIEKGAA